MSGLSKAKSGKIIALFTLTYFVSYITRINFATIISEMVSSMGVTKATLSIALTGCSITYGAGQIISGICGDRFRPKRLVLFGLLLACAMNLLIPFCKTPFQMAVVWCVNGFAQAFLWPPIAALLASSVPAEDYNIAVVRIAQGSSAATIVMYLVAPLLITTVGWKSIFLISAAVGILMAVIWQCFSPDAPPSKRIVQKETAAQKPRLLTPYLLVIMLAIILQGMLRDGVTTWMPSFISETYNLSNAISILTGVALPVLSMVCFSASNQFYEKCFSNPVQCATAIFGIGAVSALVLYATSGDNAVASVLCSALLTGCMHGVNLMLISLIPPYYKKFDSISTVSGVLNSCTYIGSAISTYGVAVFSEYAGWRPTLLMWFGIALAGTIICYICGYPAKKKAGIF